MRLKLFKNLKDIYVQYFQKCKKCGLKIIAKNGYWHYWGDYPLIKGWYHTDCGVISYNFNPKEFPF